MTKTKILAGNSAIDRASAIDRDIELAHRFLDATMSDTAHTTPGKRTITRRMNMLIQHVGSRALAEELIESVQLDAE